MSSKQTAETTTTADASPAAEAGPETAKADTEPSTDSSQNKPATKPARTSGLSPKEQKLQAMRAKLEAQKNGGKQGFGHSGFSGGKGAQAGHKKTSFQRKAT